MLEFNKEIHLIGFTKENFWDRMHADFPLGVAHFCKWIDKYKQELGWDKLFQPDIKFHDLPRDLQEGIMGRYFLENHADKLPRMKEFENMGPWSAYENVAGIIFKSVVEYFRDLQEHYSKLN